MWFEDRSLSNMKVSSLIVEEWRDIWSTKPEFMFAAIAYLFATTNLLNLPRLILDNGGPAFLVAYGASLLLIVLPILLLELGIGQLTGRGPVQAFYNICPVFKGIGIAQIVFSIFVMATMTRFLAWIFFYNYHLFWTLTDDRPGLPWLNCKNFPEFQFGDCLESASIISSNNSQYVLERHLATFHEDSALRQFAGVLEASSANIAQIGQFQLHWLIAHSIVWALVFCAICFGVRWLGKVMVFTLFVPLVLLLGLCGRALFLGGALEMFEPFFMDSLDWERLKDWMVWKTAGEQAIIATGLGFGAFITLGSYNKRSNNLVQDSFLLLFAHILISALQLTTIIALIGHISQKVGLATVELIYQGENQFSQLLVYLAYIPHTKIFTGMFLFMVAFMLLNIFYVLALGILATFEDALGEKWSRCCPRFSLAFFVCAIGMCVSCAFITQSGKFNYELATGYLKYITLAIILAFELIAVSWIYCAHSLGIDLKAMLHSTCCWCLGHFILFFNYILPAVPIAIAVINLMGYSYGKYSREVRAWKFSEFVGIGIALFPLLPIPLWAFFAICRSCRHGGRIAPFRRFCIAFRSPLRYELMKGSMSSATHHRVDHNNHHQQHHFSPRYAASGPAAGGYMLLPQAPLAQPESDDVVPGSARGAGPQNPNPTATMTTMTTTAHRANLMNTSTASTIRADSASDGGGGGIRNTGGGAFI